MDNTFVEPHCVETLKDHKLRRVLYDEKLNISIWRMWRPGTGFYRVLLTFSQEGVVLQGDITYGVNTGACGTFQYSYELDWFSGKLSEDYLCGKFLRQIWVPKYAIEWQKEELARATNGEEPEEMEMMDWSAELIEGARDIITDLERNLINNEFEFHQALENLTEHGYDYDSMEIPGYGYEPTSAMWLCAVQQKFVELYAKWKESELEISA